MTSVDGVVIYRGRAVVPTVLRQQVLSALHQAHQGVSGMTLCSHNLVWWPGVTKDIESIRASCYTCHQNAPSQSPLPPVHPPLPDHPFQLVSSDFFQIEGHTYLVMVDRYSNWPTIKKCKSESAEDLIESLREYFTTYGVPVELTTDGGMAYVATSTQQFLRTWGVTHRVSSAYHPHANLRAETAVKSMKRLITNNSGRSGTLNTDKLAAALLNYRNTPDRDTNLSPAQILYARQLNDALPTNPANLKLRPEWVLTAEARERALSKRHLARHVDLLSKSKPLKPLALHDIVQVQNQRGSPANKWDLSGQVIEVLPHDAYLIKIDGSGRLTKRNRQFLRPIVPYNPQLRPKDNDKTNTNANNSDVIDSNTGPSADSWEAPTSLLPSQRHTEQQPAAEPKSATSRIPAPDTRTVRSPGRDHSKETNDDDQTTIHQNKDNRPRAGPGRAPPCPRGLSPP